MNRAGKKLRNILLLSTLATFFFVGFLGIFHFDMDMTSDGQMSSGCFMPGMSTICQMDPIEHITEWQSMFTAIPGNSDVLTILLILLTSVLLGFVLIKRSTHPHLSQSPPSKSLSFYQRRHVPIVSHIQEAFSNGILHPRLYN